MFGGTTNPDSFIHVGPAWLWTAVSSKTFWVSCGLLLARSLIKTAAEKSNALSRKPLDYRMRLLRNPKKCLEELLGSGRKRRESAIQSHYRHEEVQYVGSSINHAVPTCTFPLKVGVVRQ